MRRWQRVHPWGLWQAFFGAFVLVGATAAAVLVVAVGPAVARGVDGATGAGIVVAVAFMTVWLTVAIRLRLVGIYRGDRGLLLRHVRRSRLLPWSEVMGFEVRAARIGSRATVRDAIWVRTRDGAHEAPVQRRSRLRGWRKNTGPVLSAADFELTLAGLREAHASAQPGGGVVVR
ncbi:hypothetical protein [Micromonospora sediminicola]|uniref:hypothetical protein n=1 Tax=Micromonospora sediminicola TaxID=946078 RepID=UPI0033A07B52